MFWFQGSYLINTYILCVCEFTVCHSYKFVNDYITATHNYQIFESVALVIT